MKAQTNNDYYNILLEACKEAFQVIETKEFLYSNEAMIDSEKVIISSKESIEQIGVEANNNLIVNYQIELNVRVEFLKFLEKQQFIFERDYFIERNDFYKRCLTSINIKLTEFNKKGNRILRDLNGMGTPPNPLLFLEYMKREIKHKSLQTNETPKPQQTEPVNPDEKYKAQNLFKVGLLFATGKMNKYFTVNSKDKTVMNEGYSAPKIANELKNKSFEKWILATINNYPTENVNGNKNVFNSLDMMTKIIDHCKAKKTEIDPYFTSRLPID